MSIPLLVVDVQQCFLNQYTRHIPQRIARLIEAGDYEPILFTRFVNTPDSPYCRFLDWHGCSAEPDTALAPTLERYTSRRQIFTKPGLTGLPDQLAGELKTHAVDEVVLVGIDTDMCVLKVAMDVFDLGIKPVIMTDCCASTAGLQAHLAGLAVLSRNVGAHQLREAGLSEGMIAAPTEEESADPGAGA